MAESVGELIGQLDDPSGVGEEAKLELIARGADVVPELAARVGELERFGKLLAIEAFEALEDARACPALIGLLADEHETVVEWSALALGGLGCAGAVEPLQRVFARQIAEQVPPAWTGPVHVRAALADLGARQPVIPRRTADLGERRDDTEMWLCRSNDLVGVIDDLAEHGQVVLYFMLWRVSDDGRLYGTRHESEGWSFDWSLPWPGNVTAAHRAARHDAAAVVPSPDLLVHVAWIDEADVTTSAASTLAPGEPTQ